jgi:hypothetical protein
LGHVSLHGGQERALKLSGPVPTSSTPIPARTPDVGFRE